MANAGELSFRTVAGLRSGDHLAERSGGDGAVRGGMPHAAAFRSSGIRASSARAWPATSCATASPARAIVICNDYEFELMRQKTGLDEAGILEQTAALVITRGEHGCTIVDEDGEVDVPAVPPHRIVDPTGVGDAFRGGFMKGMAHHADYEICARLGSVAATYALEHLGGQSHAYTWPEFRERYESHFGAPGGTL